jgi:putative protease
MVDSKHSFSKFPEVTAPVSGPGHVHAAIRNGADAVCFVQSALTPEQMIESVELCASRSVRTSVEYDGIYDGRQLPEVVESIAGMSEIGVHSFVVRDPGLAAVIFRELPDVELIAAAGMRVHNVFAAGYLLQSGFTTIILEPSVPVSVAAQIKSETGLKVELSVFGPSRPSFDDLCLLGQYFENFPCAKGCSGPCRQEFLATVVNSQSAAVFGKACDPAPVTARWLDMKFFSGLVALPEILAANIDGVRFLANKRSPRYVATVTRVFRDAVDMAATGRFEIRPEWVSELAMAALFDEVTEGFYGDFYARSGRPRGLTAGCSVRRTLARMVEDLLTGEGAV